LTADWELRLGKYRVLYDIEEEVKIVAIQAVGVKIGSQLFIRNEKAEL
jgi:mRNA-degrading endonuclease RelE of RelBE toxin-antitoxin system